VQAGKLDKQLTILAPSHTQNNAGETTTTYEELATVWAQVRQPSASETIRNADTTAQAQYAIRIRWRDDVTAACRLEYQGRTLEISQVIEGHRRRTELQLVAHEVIA
jgi:SPP1 family predicted phage head-tail adaptor